MIRIYSKVIISSERYKYNNWEPGEVHRRVPDFCTAITNPLDLAYLATRNFKNKRCPLLAGVSSNFFTKHKKIQFLICWNCFPQTEVLYNMETFSQFKNIVPVTFVGKWRFTVSYIYNKEPLEQDCVQVYLEIIEG